MEENKSLNESTNKEDSDNPYITPEGWYMEYPKPRYEKDSDRGATDEGY
jgi:hypothetical protein